MLFVDNIVLIDKYATEGVNNKLKKWKGTLEAKGFRLSRLKIEYFNCPLSDGEVVKRSRRLLCLWLYQGS